MQFDHLCYARAGQWGGNKMEQSADLASGSSLHSWPMKKRWSHSHRTPAPRWWLRGLKGPHVPSRPPAQEPGDPPWRFSSSDDYYPLERDWPHEKQTNRRKHSSETQKMCQGSRKRGTCEEVANGTAVNCIWEDVETSGGRRQSRRRDQEDLHTKRKTRAPLIAISPIKNLIKNSRFPTSLSSICRRRVHSKNGAAYKHY